MNLPPPRPPRGETPIVDTVLENLSQSGLRGRDAFEILEHHARTLERASQGLARIDRHRIFAIGRELAGYELGEDRVVQLGEELKTLSEVCPDCLGEGIDGDPGDAAGVGAATWPCETCGGNGRLKTPTAGGEA